MKRGAWRRRWAVVCFGMAVFFLSAGAVRAEGLVRIDDSRAYRGMNASFAKGYAPSIKKHAMQLVIPFRTREAVLGNAISIGVSFEREENSPFYFQNYQKQVAPLKNGVYLYRCKIRLRRDRVNGQYPLHLYALAQTEEGTVREEFTIYVEISDGQAAFFPQEEQPEAEGSLTERAENTETEEEEEIIRQPRILMERNSLQGKAVSAAGSEAWTLAARNCSADQAMENVKVTLLSEEKELVFEKNAWYFERIEANGTMDLSQNITVGRAAPEAIVPVQFQFEYEDKKGTAYTCTETALLSVCQTQRAGLAGFEMPERLYAADTVAVPFQVQNTGLAVIYNARVRLEGAGLFAKEAFLGNIEAGMAQDGEMQIFAGTLAMDAQGEVTDETAQKYGESVGRIVFSYETAQGEVVEQEQIFSTIIQEPQTVSLHIEEEKEETNQWWITIALLFLLLLLLTIAVLYLKMKHYQRMGQRIYERT